MNGDSCEITSVAAREILDSRGNPTVECEVTLKSGVKACASVPSGASTGKNEAYELRDGDELRYGGLGTLRAVQNVREKIAPSLLGVPVSDQQRIDSLMIALDGTYNKSNLGANAILSVSLACARTAARFYHIPLYRYLGGVGCHRLPVPMFNLLNGGAHAANSVDVQEFMILPVGASSFRDAVHIASRVSHTLREILKERSLSSGIGDEGGFAPELPSDEEALVLLSEAVERAGFHLKTDVVFALDMAASEWYIGKEKYRLRKSGKTVSGAELAAWIGDWVVKYPIASVEDGMGEEDTAGWKLLTDRLSSSTLLVGDDLFVTSPSRIRKGIEAGIANAVLIKPNQIGTLSETYEAVREAKRGGYRVILSHRSGETEDSFLADLAVALSADYLKAGAPVRSERTAKYNRMMAIESELFMPVYGN